MLVIGMAVAWAGYGVASWGWVLLKGDDITFTAWMNPVAPFDWAAKPGKIPPGQVNPSAKGKPAKNPVQAKAA